MAKKKATNIFPIIVGLFGAGLMIGVVRGSVTSPGLQIGGGKNGEIDPSYFSRYFTREQVTASATAERENINNIASDAIMKNAQILAQKVLDPIAQNLGYAPNVVSWFRNTQLNAKVGGAQNSDHLEALASDLDEENNSEIVEAILRAGIPFKQLILYNSIEQPSFIHISYDPDKLPGEQLQKILLKKNGTYSNVPLSQLNNLILS